jgi:basic membrane lipoprotein Med (substrate-binding protein (PBP1-ABC) superfamily)
MTMYSQIVATGFNMEERMKEQSEEDWTKKMYDFNPEKSNNVISYLIKKGKSMKALNLTCGLCHQC